jgi:hypothetical protein
MDVTNKAMQAITLHSARHAKLFPLITNGRFWQIVLI